MFAIGFPVLVVVLARTTALRVRSSSEARDDLLLFAHSPARRLSFNAAASLWSVAIFFVLFSAVPQFIREIADVPLRVNREIVARLETDEFRAGEARLRAAARESSQDLAALEQVLKIPLQTAAKNLDPGIRRDREKDDQALLAALAPIAAALVALLLLFSACFPWLVESLADSGLGGLASQAPSMLKASRGALLAVPVFVVLAVLDVTPDRPLLWILVFVPAAIYDSLLIKASSDESDLLISALGSTRFHAASGCPRIAKVPEARLRWVPAALARRVGLTPCLVCTPLDSEPPA